MNIINTVRKIRLCEGEAAAQLLLETIIEQQKKEERKKMWEAINSQIVSGDIVGNGTDKTAERNGLILATNIICQYGI